MSKAISIIFYTLAIIYILLMNQLPILLAVVAKSAPIFLLLVPIWLSLSGKLRAGMIIAILFSAGGDILLALDGAIGDFFRPWPGQLFNGTGDLCHPFLATLQI